MQTTWDEYLDVRRTGSVFEQCRRRCLTSFDGQRRNIERALETLQPSTVACLGAGILNDIPYPLLVRSKSSVHLVDWARGAVEEGIGLSIIQNNRGGAPDCVYCRTALDCPERFCKNYERPRRSSASVCGNYRATSGDLPRCAAFERGDQPQVHAEDATGGFATSFGRGVLDALQGICSWKQAFARAATLVEAIARQQPIPMSIADGSIELVMSSMLISQFEHEPYDYFARQAAAMIGPPTAQDESQLHGAMEALRSALLLGQIRGHCREIARITAPGGCCYMSFELFHVLPERASWFLLKGVTEALETIASYFRFDFDILSHEQFLTRFQTEATPSLCCSFALKKPRS